MLQIKLSMNYELLLFDISIWMCMQEYLVFSWLSLFQLAGFKLEVVKTTCAGHAKKLASTVDFSTCPDGTCYLLIFGHFAYTSYPLFLSLIFLFVFFLVGIVCVGGDGIVNEVCLQSFPLWYVLTIIILLFLRCYFIVAHL